MALGVSLLCGRAGDPNLLKARHVRTKEIPALVWERRYMKVDVAAMAFCIIGGISLIPAISAISPGTPYLAAGVGLGVLSLSGCISLFDIAAVRISIRRAKSGQSEDKNL